MSKPCPCDRVGASLEDSCIICWRWYHDTPFRVVLGGPTEPPPLPTRVYRDASLPPPPPDRPNRCESLDVRTEFKAGCNGWTCEHACLRNLPAVPGVYCQTCTSYVDSGDAF